MGFSDQSGQNNLQYDNAAFFFFLATLLIVGAIIILFFLLKDWKDSQIPRSKVVSSISVLQPQFEATKVLKRSVLKSFGLKIKIFGLVLIGVLLWLINIQIRNTENKLKGFDPYNILGLTPQATLRDVKKAYRKLALQFHPDRNVGDPEAQAKFILISKSYECFTDDSKKENCFKYGNPDGNTAFNVGIGLPHFFISKDYQYYVLPVVLSFLLIFLPNYFIRWSARAKAQDQSGISLTSYSSLYSTILSPINIFTPLYQLASLIQLYEDCPALSEHDKARLLQDLQKAGGKKPIIQDFNNKQLFILNAVFRYCLRETELDSNLRFKIQQYMNRLIYTFLPFSQRASQGKFLQGNIDWKIQFQGEKILSFQIKFIRCYYNRSFNPSWQQVLRLNQQQQEIAKQSVVNNLYQLISNKQMLDKYIENYPLQRREYIKNQFNSLPIYNLQVKLKVSKREVSQVNTQQYAQFYYRITRKNGTSGGFCNLANYPYLKEQKMYFTMCFQENLINISEIVFREGESVHIGKIPYRMEYIGNFPITIRLNSDCYEGLDVGLIFNLKCVEPPEQLKNGKVKIHQEDLEIQKKYKGFLDELMNASQMEDNQLSDSEDE